MHEVGLARAALQTLKRKFPEGIPPARGVRFGVGEWSGVVSESLQVALHAVFVGTPLEAAELEFSPLERSTEFLILELLPKEERACVASAAAPNQP